MSSYINSDEYIYTRFITRNGKRIYHPTGGLYKFPRRAEKSNPLEKPSDNSKGGHHGT